MNFDYDDDIPDDIDALPADRGAAARGRDPEGDRRQGSPMLAIATDWSRIGN